jgi:hypothetical protein
MRATFRYLLVFTNSWAKDLAASLERKQSKVEKEKPSREEH